MCPLNADGKLAADIAPIVKIVTEEQLERWLAGTLLPIGGCECFCLAPGSLAPQFSSPFLHVWLFGKREKHGACYELAYKLHAFLHQDGSLYDLVEGTSFTWRHTPLSGSTVSLVPVDKVLEIFRNKNGLVLLAFFRIDASRKPKRRHTDQGDE